MSNKKFKKSEVFTISSAHMIHDIYSAFLAPLLPLLIEKLGISLSVILEEYQLFLTRF